MESIIYKRIKKAPYSTRDELVAFFEMRGYIGKDIFLGLGNLIIQGKIESAGGGYILKEER